METKISITQSLRELPIGKERYFPIRQRTTIINTIQRLRCEGYEMKMKTAMQEKKVYAIKVSNPIPESIKA